MGMKHFGNSVSVRDTNIFYPVIWNPGFVFGKCKREPLWFLVQGYTTLMYIRPDLFVNEGNR